MSARCDCYGSLFSDFTRVERNQRLHSPAFSALLVSQGIGMKSRALEVKADEWDKCVACDDDRTCYDLSLSKLVMNTILTNGRYGA